MLTNHPWSKAFRIQLFSDILHFELMNNKSKNQVLFEF